MVQFGKVYLVCMAGYCLNVSFHDIGVKNRTFFVESHQSCVNNGECVIANN